MDLATFFAVVAAWSVVSVLGSWIIARLIHERDRREHIYATGSNSSLQAPR